MGVIAKGILRGCQGLFTPVSLRYPLPVFNKNSTLKQGGHDDFAVGPTQDRYYPAPLSIWKCEDLEIWI